MSNTKLNSDQREILADMLQELDTVELFSFPEFDCVVGIERTGANMGSFAVSIRGVEEEKFRKNVGKYTVLCKFDNGNTMPVYIGGNTLETLAWEIAQVVGRVR